MVRDQRGVSMSAFFAVVVVGLVLVAGLVVDGGAQALAARRAELVASAAARAAADATAADRIAGAPVDAAAAIEAGRRELAASGDVTGTVTLVGGRVHVETTSGITPVFLTLIGIRRLGAHGSADAELVANR
jgi:hypothetical protein